MHPLLQQQHFKMPFFPKHTLITLLSIISIFTLITPSSSSSQPQPSNSTHFIQQSCNMTTYPSLCLKTLSSFSGISTPFALCDAALDVAIQAAKNCSSKASPRNRKRLELDDDQVVKDCASELKDAVYELKETVAAMSKMEGGNRDSSNGEKEFQWSNAKTYASAAITDAETCVDGFDEEGKKKKGGSGGVMRKKMKMCIGDVEKLISNALSLINHLY